MRKCPGCGTLLEEIEYHKEKVDRCPGCGGVFFDQGELEAIISLVDLFQNVTLAEKEINTISSREHQRELECPVCTKIMLKRDVAGTVIDVCQTCRGIWLDEGEIIALKLAENHIKENLNLYIRLGN